MVFVRSCLCLLLWVMVMGSSLRAQSSSGFSQNPDEFVKQLTQVLLDTKRDDCKEAAQQLMRAWSGFSPGLQRDLMQVAERMQKRRMLTYPYFFKLAEVVLAYHRSDPGAEIWNSWTEVAHTVLEGLRQGNNKQFDTYLDFSLGLFAYNALHQTSSRSWKMQGGVFELIYENGVPCMVVEDADLIGASAGDSIRIMMTSGRYYPLENKWVGKGGRVDWSRVGLGSEELYALLGDYQVLTERSEYSADSVRLYYAGYPKSALFGTLRDKVLSRTDPERLSYPKFVSYRTDLVLDHLVAYTRAIGGIELAGNQMALVGNAEKEAVLRIYRFDNLLGVLARSQRFAINKEQQISAAKAFVKIYFGKDSLLHFGATLRYNGEERELFISRGASGIQRSPFYDYYHGFEITPEMIYWNMGETDMIIRNLGITGGGTVGFESFNYFRASKMDKYQGIADYNLIDRLKQVVDRSGQKEFYAEDLARRIDPRYSLETIEAMLYKLVEDGFIDYDERFKIVRIRSKVFQYVAAKQKMIDYDNLRFESVSEGVNARVDMRSYQMEVHGVKNFVLSDSNFVVAFPRGQQVTLGQNRAMDFNGSLFAGRLDLSGEGFSLDYSKFRLNLSHVDSVIINIPTGQRGSDGRPTIGPIRSVIADVTGYLEIDAPQNRSGIKRIAQYPSLTTTQPSYVYFDHSSIRGGVYDREKFYLKLDPFVFDSLNTFRWDRVVFSGTLVSDNIFPELRETVRIQEDLSLGFRTVRQNLSLYGGKGTFSNQIVLNAKGLQGSGDIRYVGSLSRARYIVFYPDSTHAELDSFIMNAGVVGGQEFPTVRGRNNRMRWLPYEDSMLLDAPGEPFRLFDLKTTMSGTLVLQGQGLRGRGVIDWAEATLSSNDIAFGKNRLSADSCHFLIKSLDPKKAALLTQDVAAAIDFDKRIGDFRLNDAESQTIFPYNQYQTTINEFRWNMGKQLLTFRAPGGSLADFASLHPRQEGLVFQGNRATYNINNYMLTVEGVPSVDVVDSRFVPDSNKVVIEADARMRTLQRARLLMDSISAWHVFDSVTANISGRNAVTASGRYTYVNHTKKKQQFYCQDIGVFTDPASGQRRMYAVAQIDSQQRFTVLPKIQFKGSARIVSAQQPLQFKGYARLDVQNPKVISEWFPVDNYLTEDSLYLTFDQQENVPRRRLICGLMLDADSNDLYVSLFNTPKFSRDRALFSATGIVYYDPASSSFIVGDREKIVQGNARGNMVRFQDTKGKMYAEGLMQLGLNIGMVEVKSAGSVVFDVSSEEPTFRVAIGFGFPMEENLLTYMAQSVLKGNSDGEYADYTSEHFIRAISEFLTPQQENRWREQLNRTGHFFQEEALPYTIFISDVTLRWNKESRSFYNTGPFALAFVGKNSIATVVNGYLEIGYKRGGDFFHLFLPAGDEEDYYFFLSYSSNALQLVSGEKAFNQLLADIKPDKRQFEKDGKIFMYHAGSEHRKNTFVNRMKALQQQAAAADKLRQQKK